MTIQNTTTRKAGPSQGNGVTTVFPFTFKVFTATDILVTYLNVSGVESVLVLSTNYTVSLNADQNTSPGGSVTLLVAPATATYITLTSQVTNTQTLALTNSGGFYPESINNALDRTVIEIQQLAEQASRSITIPKSSTASPLLPIPTPLNVLAWNVDGTAITNVSLESSSNLSSYKATGTGSVTRTVAAKLNDTVSVKDFGAVGDHVTDDTAAIQAAINAMQLAGGGTVFMPVGIYRTTATINVLAAVVLEGEGTFSYRPPLGYGGGVTIMPDSSVVIGVLVGQVSAANGGSGLSNLCVTRNVTTSTIPVGSVGIKTGHTDHCRLINVQSFFSAIPFWINGNERIILTDCRSGYCTDTHVLIGESVIAPAAEVTFTNCRFGGEGGLEPTCNNYIRLSGAVDTVSFMRCQFNASGASIAGYAVYFYNYNSPNGIISFVSCHCEGVIGGFIQADGASSSTYIRRINITTSTLYAGGANFFQIADTSLLELNISNSSLAGAITLNNQPIFNITNNFLFNGLVTLNTGSGTFSNNSLYQGLTITGAYTDACAVTDNAILSGSVFTNTATGTINVSGNVTANATANAAIINKIGTGYLEVLKGNKLNDGTVTAAFDNMSSQVRLGTTSAHDLYFSTNSVERMRVLAAGNIQVVNGVNNTTTSIALKEFTIVGASNAITSSSGNLQINTNDVGAVDLGGMITLGGRYSSGDIRTITFAGIKAGKANSTAGNTLGYLSFGVNISAGGIPLTEAMRLTALGGLNVGAYSADTALGSITASGTIKTGGYIVTNLPTGVVGMRTYVTNALTPAWGSTVVTGGAVTVPVFYNGTNWIVG